MTDTDTIQDQRIAALEERVRGQDQAKQAVQNLIALAIDPKAAKRILRSIHDSLVAEAEAQKKTRDERAAFDEYKAKETAELEQQKKMAGSIWERAQSRERAVEAREQACHTRETELGLNARNPDDEFVPMQGSGMSRTYPRAVRHDDLGQAFPEHTTLTRQTETPEPGAAEPPDHRPCSVSKMRPGFARAISQFTTKSSRAIQSCARPGPLGV